MSQQPKRPRVENTQPKVEGTVDVRQMYSTAAGDAAPKPFAELKGKLHPGLLDGLDKMGFE
jgi:ATP-dependent RNA helicase MSS116